MERIVVAVDGSDVARRALDLATDLASKYGAEIIAVNVYTPLYIPPEPYAVTSADLEMSLRHYGEDIARESAEAVRAKGVAAEWVAANGAPADTLLEVAKARKADLVVVGSRGRGAVSRVLLGSVSSRLSHICDRPLLIVH